MDPFEEADNGPARDLRDGLEAAFIFGEGDGYVRDGLAEALVETRFWTNSHPRAGVIVDNRAARPEIAEVWMRLPDGRSIPCKAVPVPNCPGSFTIVPECDDPS